MNTKTCKLATSTTLLICGQRIDATQLSDSDMTAVADMTSISNTPGLIVRRCTSPSQLSRIVAEVAAEVGPIDILDLYDHGNVGHQRMGDGILFSSDNDPASRLEGEDIATELRQYLSDTAQIRLLGCLTVAPKTDRMIGRLLAIKLARALGGHRVVFGTIGSVTVVNDFRPTGFNPDVEATMLFSSLGALDTFPPTTHDRKAHIMDTRRLQNPDAAQSNPEI